MNEQVEIKWFWRRVLTFGLIVVCLGLLTTIVCRLTNPDALKWIALGLIGVISLAHVIYLTGSTSTDVARLIAAARSGETPKDPA